MHGLKCFFHHYVRCRILVLRLACEHPRMTAEEYRSHTQHGHRGEHKERQLPGSIKQNGHSDDQRRHLPEKLGEGKRQQTLQLGYIGGNAAGELSHTPLFEIWNR